MSRIEARFALCYGPRAAARLIPFLEAFDPDLATTAAAILRRHAREAGADLIEIGMPFTDPMADGPTIQACRPAAGLAGRRHAGWHVGHGAPVPCRR